MKRRHALLALLVIGGCIEGGANLGGRQAGNQDGGLVLAFGEIAVDAHGRYFLSRAGEKLVVGDLSSLELRVLDGLPQPDVLAFWSHTTDPGFYLLSWSSTGDSASTGAETVLSYDLSAKRVVWRREISRQDGRLDVAPDGARVLLTDGRSLAFLDPLTGATLHELERDDGVNDVDFTPDGSRVIVTGFTTRDEARAPFTSIALHATADGRELCRVTVPNCSSELVLGKSGRRAFLAPTLCGRDPVSVIDLDDDTCRFHGNLPGFGPVALSPDGDTVVAFADRDARDPEAPALPEAIATSSVRYHLLFIDAATLALETAAIGDALPRYTFTPDGRALLVDSSVSGTEPIVILDVAARTVRKVAGEGVDLGEYALTPDAKHAYVLDRGLWDLDLGAATLTRVPLSFLPRSINMTPDGERLLLKDELDARIWIYEVSAGRVSGGLACTDPSCS